jgi:hypothetical protein
MNMTKIKVNTGESGGHSPGAYYKEPALAIVDINSEESLEKWGKVLELSRKELLEAVNSFGPVVRDIRLGLLNQEAA